MNQVRNQHTASKKVEILREHIECLDSLGSGKILIYKQEKIFVNANHLSPWISRNFCGDAFEIGAHFGILS